MPNPNNTPGKKVLNIVLPRKLHNMFKKLAVDRRTTITAIIVQYGEYLESQYYRKRELLHGESRSAFKVDEGEPE